MTQDANLHLVERARSAQRTRATGEQITEQQLKQPDRGDPGSGLRVSILINDTVRPGLPERRPQRLFECATRMAVLEYRN
jgi:hypothetical protein